MWILAFLGKPVSKNIYIYNYTHGNWLSTSYSLKQLKHPSSLPPRDWPRSRNPKDWERVLAGANCSVIPSFQRALSLNASVFSRIGVVRNFYAHRNGATAARVIHTATLDGVFPISHPKEYCLAVSAGRVLPNVDEWITELELFAREMVY